MKSVIDGGAAPVGFGLLLSLVQAVPGTTPDQLFSTLMTYRSSDDAWWFKLRTRIGLAETFNYLAQLPDGYDADPAKRWPLILFLHGSGDRGTDVTSAAIFHGGPPQVIAGGRKVPAIVVSPRCPDEWWSAPVLGQFIDVISAKYRVDPDRIIVTGASMGGFGTWELAEKFPDRFAAIAPICGGGNPAQAACLSKLPIWTFHGQLDTTIPAFLSQNMVAAIQKAGGAPHLTIYPTAGHDAWTQAYATDALYTWMLAQQRGKPEVKTPGLQEP
jgi:predicted peptidase